MSIQEICELSSILESDDREKAELQKKNLTILGSIKQQESRLQHELDEKSKFVLSLYRLDGRCQDFSTNIEMTMLSISELAESRQKIENSGITSKTDNYIQKKEELVKRVYLLQSNFKELDTSLRDIEGRYANLRDSNPIKLIKESLNTHYEEKNRSAQQLSEVQSKLVTVENRLTQELNSIEESISRKKLLLHEAYALQLARQDLEARVQSLVAESNCKLRLQEEQLELATCRSLKVENDLETGQQILNNTYMKCEDIKSALSVCTNNEKLKKIQLNELEENMAVLEEEINTLEKVQVDSTEDHYRRNSEIQNVKSEISSIRKTHELTKRTMNFSEKAASLEAEVVPLRKSVQEHRESIDRLRSELSGENVKQRQQRIAHLHQESDQLESELADITNRKIPHTLMQIESTAVEVTATTSELAVIKYKVTELQHRKCLQQENLKLRETTLQTVREAFCAAMNAATKDINLTKESSSSMPSLAFTTATADEMLHQMAKSIVIKENAVSELSAQLLAEQSALSSTRSEIVEAEAEAAAMLSIERASYIRRKKASCISQKRDELSRVHQAELSQLRKTITEGDIAFRQQLQKNQAELRKRAEIHAQLEQRAAQLRGEHGKQMELLRVSSEGHHPLLDSSSDPFSNGLMNMMAQQFTDGSQLSASEGVVLTPVDKWAVVLPDALPHHAQKLDYSHQTAMMESEVDLFASQEDADIMMDQSQSSLVQATAAATAPSGGMAKARTRGGTSRGRSGGRGESSQSPQRDDRDEARSSRRRKKSSKGGLDERTAALSQQPRTGSQEGDDGKQRAMARMRSSRAVGK